MIWEVRFLGMGLVAGAIHFGLLWLNTALYAPAGRPWMAGALQIARLGALAGVLTITAMGGASPLLLTALGLLIARPIVLRWMAVLS